MVANILAAFDERVDTLDWMSAATKRKAKEKIATIRVGVGYPETWRNYTSLAVRADDAPGNHLRPEPFEYEHQPAKPSPPGGQRGVGLKLPRRQLGGHIPPSD